MSSFAVCVDETTFAKSHLGRAVTGVIFFDFGDYQFPERNWNDFAAVVLSWWGIALKEVVAGISEKAELRFMDGPFCVVVEKRQDDMCEVKCYDADAGEPPEYIGRYSCTEVFDSVVSAAKATYDYCVNNQMGGDAVSGLKDLLGK